MKLSRTTWVGISFAAAIAVVVSLLAFAHLSGPSKRTVVVSEVDKPVKPATEAEVAAARKRVDERVAMIRKAGEPLLLADFIPKPVPPEDDAAAPLLAAIRWLGDKEKEAHPAWQLDVVPTTLTEADWRAIDDAVAKFAPGLALIDQADGRTRADWKIQYKSPAIQILLPSLNGARHVQNLLRLAALSAHRAGRHDEAVRRIAQMLALARHVDGHIALVSHLVACGCARRAIETIADIVPTLTIGQAAGSASPASVRALVATLLDEQTLRPGWRAAVLGERMFLYDTMQGVADGRLSMAQLESMMSGRPRNAATTTPAPRIDQVLADLVILLDHSAKTIEAAKMERLADYRRAAPAGRAEIRLDISRMMATSFDGAAATHYTTVAHLQVAAGALAARLWWADHQGATPPSLDALVPKYLPAVPIDPVAPAPALVQYRATPEPAVFSVGPPQTARSGKAATRKTPSPEIAIRLVAAPR